MTYEAILKNLKSKIYAPIYFLSGEEPYYIDKIAEFIEKNVLDENEKEFNQTILYGKETDLSTVLSNAKRFPMMSNYQVVIIREAQEVKNLLPKKNEDGKQDKDKENTALEEFLAYIENPQASTILVFCCKYKSLDKRSKLYKSLEKKKAVSFESARIYENKVPAWIENYLAEQDAKISSRTSLLLTEYLGNDLSKIANELDKLLLNLKKGEEITTQHIEKYIGISKDFNVFELQDALGKKNSLKAYRIVKYFGANKKDNPFVLTIANLYAYYSKILKYHTLANKSKENVASALGVNPYFIRDYETAAKNYSLPKVMKVISLLHRFDLKSKGVNSATTEEGELLQELVSEILMN